jgi:hypothetical protein
LTNSTKARAKGEKRLPLYTLLAPTIAGHLKTIQDAGRATHWYFRTGCRFVKALEDHIIKAGQKTCVIDKEDRRISYHRGTGAAIEVKNPVFHIGLDDEPDSISFKLEVGFEPLENDAEYTHDGSGDVERAYHINFPVDLEENFTTEKFNSWITKTRARLRAETDKTEHRFLEKMIQRHPEKARELISKRKRKSS